MLRYIVSSFCSKLAYNIFASTGYWFLYIQSFENRNLEFAADLSSLEIQNYNSNFEAYFNSIKFPQFRAGHKLIYLHL